MALDVMSMFARLGLDKSEYEKGMKEAEGGFKGFGSKLKAGVANVAKIAAGAAAAGAAAFTAVTAAVTKGVSEVAAFGDNIDKASQKMGISAKAYQEWDAVLQHSGTSIDALGIGMKTLSSKAAEGSDAFKKLGISQKDAAKMSREELFSRTITALQGVKDANKKAQLAQELFGRSAMELGPLLNTTAEDTQAMKDQVNALGGVLSDEAVKASAAYQDALQDMNTAMDGMKRGLFASFLPSMTQVMQGITDVFTGKGTANIRKGIRAFIDGLGKTLPTMLKRGLNIASAIGGAVISAVPDVISRVTKALPKLWNGVKAYISVTLLPAVSKLIASVLGRGNTSLMGERLTGTFRSIFDKVISVVEGIGKKVSEFWTKVLLPIRRDIVEFMLFYVLPLADQLLEAVSPALEWLGDTVSKVFTGISELWNSVVMPVIMDIFSVASDIWENVKQQNWGGVGKTIWNAIKGGFKVVNGWLLKLVLGDDYKPESGWGDAGAKIWGAIKDGFAVVNGWLLKLVLGDEYTPESGWGDAGAKIWGAIKDGFAAVNGWLLQLVLGDEYTPESGWGDAGAKIWGAIQTGFAVVNGWLLKLVLGDEYTPESGWGDAGAKIWQSIKDGFAITSDWLKKLLLGEDEYTPDATWADVGKKIWDKIIEGLASAVDWLKNLLDDWTTKLSDGTVDFEKIGSTIGGTIWGAIKDAFNTVVGWFKNLFGGENDEDENSVKGAIFSIDWAGLGTSIFNFIGAAFLGIVDTYKGYFQSVWDAIKGMDWSGLGDAMWAAIRSGFGTVSEWFEDTFREPVNKVIGYINEMITNFENAFNRVIASINSLLGTNFESKVFSRVQKISKDTSNKRSGAGRRDLYGGAGRQDLYGGAGRHDLIGYATGGVLYNGDSGIVGEYQPEFLQVVNGKAVVTPLNIGRFPGGGQEMVEPRTQTPRMLNVTLKIRDTEIARVLLPLLEAEEQRVGVKLSKGGPY